MSTSVTSSTTSRPQTRDMEQAVACYTKPLGVELKHRQGTAFASASRDGLDLLFSGQTAPAHAISLGGGLTTLSK